MVRITRSACLQAPGTTWRQRIDLRLSLTGERPKDQEGFLQGLQEAYHDEGDPVQDWQGFFVRPG